MKKDNWDIVSERERGAFDMGEFYYVYVPLTDEEKKLFASSILNAAWRIKVNK